MLNDHDNHVEIATGFASHHAETSLRHLLACLDINRSLAGWQDRLSPFAPVWAAMIAAGAEGHAVLATQLPQDRRASKCSDRF